MLNPKPTLGEKDEGPVCNPTMLPEAKSFSVLVAWEPDSASWNESSDHSQENESRKQGVRVQAAGSQKQIHLN